MSGTLLIISGPSGSGKSTLIQKALKTIPNIHFSISSTTRTIREQERDGIDYFFISKEEFEKGIDKEEFLEWARVHGEYYGTSMKPIKKALKENKIVLLDIDVQGHKLARERLGDIATSVFITTPNHKILEKRLRDRKTDTQASIQKRITNAKGEMKRIDEYDFILINDEFEKTFNSFMDILKASTHRVANADLKKFISTWNTK